MAPAEFARFWREGQGLVSHERLGQLVAAAEANPPLRRRGLLVPALEGMEKVCLLEFVLFVFMNPRPMLQGAYFYVRPPHTTSIRPA